jgi:cytochrome c553
MRLFKKFFSICLLSGLFLALSVSASDISEGEEACAICHGAKGNSNNAQLPSLAGQPPRYLTNQLKMFKTGQRINPIMQAIAENMSDKDMNNLPGYFYSLSLVGAGGDAGLAKLGRLKSSQCLVCHGSEAKGNGQFPRLAGQHPEYLLEQLKKFTSGIRKNEQMQAIVSKLSEKDMNEITAYFGSLK